MVNKVIFVGRLGADPDVRFTPDGSQVTSFRIASDYVRKGASGEKITETEWLSCVAWGKLADIAGQYLAKGRLVYIEGRLKTRSWEDKDGQKRFKTEAVLSEIRLLERKADAAASGNEAAKATATDTTADGIMIDDDVPF